MIPQQVSSPTECLTLIDLLRLRAEQRPDALAYRFLLTGEVDGPTEEITYSELDLRARAIAACLQGAGAAGERALLLYPPGLEFIAAFLACAYAGVVAVPTYPHRKLSRLETIASDARARFVLTTVQFSKISPALQRQTPELAKARWIVTDVPLQEQASDLQPSHIAPETLLFLQYTSGSTGHPKGVMVSHGNVLNNERLIAQGFRTGPSTHVVGWLPVYHDMGLIGNVLHPLYIGASCTLFSPLAFLQRPMRWLEAISHFQGTVSGGPNFAFDYCVAKKEIDRPLDLSSWKVAFNGSEPVRKDTIDCFTAAFAENGFSTTVFYPCYGLAEATLFVASGDPDLPVCATFDAGALERNLAVEVPSNTPGARNLVSSGECPSDHRLAIVHPETHQSCPEGGIGEIWFAGPSIARGYWDKPQETQDAFKAQIRNNETRYFLRTGDLGFLLNGQLFVAGRLKDLIIIRGRNLYPQDIEFTVQIAHTAVRPGCCAAFAVETDGAEKLVIVAEVNSQTEKTDLPLIVNAARRAVAEEHATHVRQVVLLSSNSIPKTSSGKIRRDACRKALASGELAVIFTSTIEDSAVPDPRQVELAVLESTSLAQEMRSADSQTRIGLIEKFAQRLCARHLRVYIDRVELDASPASLGLDSLMAMALQSEFEADLHVSLPEVFLLQQPTLRAAASELLAAWETQQEKPIAEDLLPGSLDGNLPLSSGQQRLWFLDQLLPGNPVYNLYFGLQMIGLLNRDLLRRSLTELISRQVILRTVFREVNGRPSQSVEPLTAPELDLIDLSSTPGPGQESRLRRLAEEFAMQPFDLAAGPLIRFHLVALAPDRHILLIAQHHIITDGWSIMVLARELAAIYRALLMKASLGPPPELQFADYARWEQLNVARWEDGRTFWRQQLSDLPSHDLPADYPRPSLRSFRGGHLSFCLAWESSAKIVSIGRAEGCTPFITLLAGYCILLARYMAQDEFAVGSFITNRGRPQLWEMIGFFTNTVVLRCNLAGAPSFRDLLRRMHLVVADALRHGKLPFAEVVQMVTGVRDGVENPLFQAAFVLESPIPEIQIPEMTWQGISWTPDGAVNGTSKFDIMLALQETAETFVGALEYSSDLFEVSTVERFAAHLSTLYDNIAMQPDRPVAELSIFSLAERQQLLVEWNRTEAEVPRDVCLPELFQRQAGKTPDSVAVFTQRSQVTYRELNQQTNRMARYLLSSGVELETVVALLLGRESEFLTCMLAVFKAGGAYLPLDPHHPLLRQLQLLQQSGVRYVISTSEWARELAATVPPGVQVIDIEAARGSEEADTDLPALCRPSHLAYVIYTSGSTGTPKGAMVEHLGMLNHLYAKVRDLQLSESDVVAQTASQAFDISVWQFLAVLLVGGRVRIVSEEVAAEPAQLMMEIDAAKISIAEMVPSMLRAGLEEMESGATTGPNLSSLRRLLLTGEALPAELVRRWLNHYPEIPLLNAYGPTECSDDVAHHCISSEAELGRVYTPIGRPIVNTRLYVLDERLQPVAIGVPGELYVGGICVGRGYQNDAAHTAETFIPDLYATEEGVRLYRTGDVVRWLPRGEIVFLGRRDHQVKIRGFRIELGEIEALLESQAGVKQALVLAQADQRENQRLVAYVAVREEITPEQLEQGLKQRLPEYMVPAVYVLLPSMPLTPNGKIDRQALPAVELGMGGEECYVAPRTPVEEILCGIWQEVLAVERVGVKENFFHLGGHSLLATQVMARVRFSFGIDLPLRTMFERPTVDAFAAHVEQSLGAGTHAAPPIQRRGRDGELPLSFAQERLWFLSRYELETSLYNVPVAMRLRGELNIEAAKASLQEMVNRHEVLRTSFPEVGDGTIQDIAAEMEVPFAAAEIREDELNQVLREQARQSFDLSHGPLIRASLFRISSQDHVLLVAMHHIVSDGWSLGVMLREFNVLYDSFSRREASPLPPLPIQYADYSEWQREWLQGEVLERQLDYWRKQLAGHETLNLPTDRPHSARPTLAGAMETSRWPEPLVSKLKLLSDQQGVTLFMTLLAGFEILLYRYTGQTDISVGSAIANRNRQELEPLIGFFVNTLVLRTQFREDSSVAELLQRAREVSLQAYAHQDIPFERLVEALDPVRELSRTPFFQVMFVLQNAPLPTVSWDGLEATASILETGTAKFDLTLSALEEDGEVELSLEYRTELFNAERIRRLLQHYRTLLEHIVVSVDSRIGELEILSEAERRQLLVEWNSTEAPYSTNQCVHQLFEEQTAKTPQAVVDEDGQISYGELNRRANQLAHYLAKMGVGPELRVGICMERGLEMMAGVLGVLKAGGAYVPLDPADPSARRSYMVKDAGAKFVLTNERFIQQIAGCTEHVVDLEEAREEIEKQSGENLRLQLDAENLASVVYTSSSAGQLKGTAIPHRSAVSLMQSALIDAMDQNPSVERWLNLYAPTEDTTYATYAEVELGEQGSVTIGRSQSNTQAYVLDGHMKLVPVGIKGELYIGGAGQARRYLNRPELTAEKFVPNPFSKTSGERLYRTGDLARYQENGNLEFLGRLDSQVKIQGHRIEPEEIEAALLGYPGIAQAAVIAREDEPGNVRLVGYVAGSERLDIDRLRSHLQQRVPEYMVPAALLQLDTLPLTPNGKVDRKALLELESKKAMETGSLTLTATEELIAGVWSSLLGKSQIRRDDNFFDLGGHSLMVIQMLSRLRQVFNREIDLRAMFESPVLKDLSAHVDRLTGSAQLATLRPIVPTSRDGDLPLSFAQQRLWFLGQLEGASAAYHIPFGLHLKGDLNRTALGRALDRILVRHEVLRTTFAFHDGEPVQEIGAVEESSFRLIEHDLRGRNEVEAELAVLRELEAGASFDLEAGPLIRGRLIRLAEDEHVLLVTMHHIVSDGWSMGVMVRELKALYEAFIGGEADPLPELAIQYADYAVWQRQWIEGEILQQQAAYWKTTLAGAPALLKLPTDHTRPVRQDFAGGSVELMLDEQLTAGLKDLSRRNGTTLYMTLLAGWAILLARLSGQQEVVIGSPVANRGRAEIENLIGFFVNTLALRLDLSGSPSVSELLEQAKARSLAAQRHQDIPFEQVVELAQPVRSLANSPLFQVMFSWQNATEARLELPGLEVQPLPSASYLMAKFDLTLSLQEMGERIVGELEYATALYERSTVERYREYFVRLVEAMLADDAQPIDRLRMLSEEEREQVLYEWNATERGYPRDKCVHELFEEQVRRSPQATAVVFEEEELSYGELNARANRLAHYLRELGVQPDARVAICVERGFEMIVGLLAILKAGGAYVPLDPAYPVERLRFMLEDSDPAALLTQTHLKKIFPELGDALPVLDLADAEAAWHRLPANNPKSLEIGLAPQHLAYVIYTSGSTGVPKGVAIEHRNAVNFISWAQFSFACDVLERTLLSTSLNFDLAVFECFVPLSVGATVRLVLNALDLTRTQVNVTLINTVPSAIHAVVEANGVAQTVRTINLAGEPLKSALAERIFAATHVDTVCNLYGPSETTTYSTWVAMRRGDQFAPHIGRPISNTQVYILDARGEPVPVGVAGELYIGGAGVARGYLKRPELTAERFVADPFVEEPGARMYRTGDLGRWLPDGNIEFLGRNDFQVKIRGFRIELREIEARLAEHPAVREAVVLAREDTAGEKRLVAYYTASGSGEGEAVSVGAERLRAHLSAVLPDYMVPTVFVELQKLPLTPNGKLDRKALPAPEAEAYAAHAYEAPQGAMETKLADVWAEVLQLEKVGRHDNFFELGGHSLMAARVATRMRESFKVDIPIRRMFEAPTIAQLAEVIDQALQTAGVDGAQSRLLPAIKRVARKAALLPVERIG